jgi:CBS domain containing-hemolysin-like protein
MAAVLVFSTVVQMVLGELAPKNLAIARTVPMARALSRSTLLYLRVAGPVVRTFDVASNRLLRLVGIEPVEELPHGAGAEELHRIIEDSRRGGLLDDELSRLLDRGLGFRELVAAQVMTPRVDVRTVRADDPVSRVVELLACGSSRFPVTGRDVDDVVGVIGIPDLLTVLPSARATTPVAAVAQPPLRLPATLPLPMVLDRLRAERRQLAMVVDEYGGFAGVVSFEDVAEEVVGDILDEDDPAEPVVLATADDGWTLPARLRLDEVEELTGVVLPGGEDYDTVSGLLLDRLGRTAHPGDSLDLPLAPAHGDLEPQSTRTARFEVRTVHRHVPAEVSLQLLTTASRQGRGR